ncbi:hypothetical protein [Phenylobacterium sp.]|jgi:hypothetical protein|uniref:hypothetical protein n=1 Tax=Phenylobacterium sp. TaxID=1871053 RepID=UPI00122BC1C4|nr:hypothetical protein [Phenylobacterium sp.]THD55049.1 MAG: hypothetical protein E8A12_16500 [Phenylobacterium sp.]
MRSPSQGPAPSLTRSDLSPCDRFLARRRAIFLRDWILALIALGLVLAATLLRSEPRHPAPDAPQAAHPGAPQI